MPLDPSIILGIGDLNNPDRMMQTRANALKLMQMQRQEKAQNTLQQLMSQPGAIDAKSGMISPNTLAQVATVDYSTYADLADKQTQLQSDRVKLYTEYGQRIEDSKAQAAATWEDVHSSTGSKEAADQAAQAVWDEDRKSLAASGILPSDIAANLPTQFDRIKFELGSKAFNQWQKAQTAERRADTQDYIAAVGAGIDPGSIGLRPPGAPTGQQATGTQLSENDAASAITKLFPGSTITSEKRTPERNKEVGGVPTSAHISGQAIDFVKPKGSKLSADQVKQTLRDEGLPVTSVLDEGDHFHWEWEPKGEGQTPSGPIFTGPGKGATFITGQDGKQYIANPNRPGKFWDAQTGQPTEGPKDFGKTGTAQDVPPAGDPRVESEAQMIAGYRLPPLSNFVLKTGYGQAVMDRVNKINPTYDATQYNAKNKAVTAFDSGPQGNQVRSLNVAIQHMNLMDQLSAAIKNGNVQTINTIKNRFAEEFGGADVTNFDVAKGIVGDEIVKAVVAGGGALADRENAQNQISRAKSFDQLTGAFNTARKLLSGQLKGLKRQYESSTGLKNFEEKLDPETRTQLEGQSGAAQKSGKRAKDMTDDELKRSLGL